MDSGSSTSPSREEAIEIAQAQPACALRDRRGAPRRLRGSRTPIPEQGTPFLFVFRREPGLSDDDGAKLREMIAFGEELASRGTLLETAPLVGSPPRRASRCGGGKALVTDGPFAEAKEAVGGYGVVRVADRAAAVELAKRYPHARWGPVEVREILFFDPV